MATEASPLVSVVIVSYETKELTLVAIRSLLEHTVAYEIEVIVVDNASTDGTADALVNAHLPHVRVVRLDTNVGFARGVNLGAEMARGNYVLLLNPDTVIHDDVVKALVDFAVERDDLGLLGGRTLNTDGTPNPGSCFGLPTLWSITCFGLGLTTIFAGHRLFDPESLGSWPRDTARDVGLVTGCLLLTSTEVWRELGGFDEQYFMYSEDADLAKRAWAAGYRQMITPDAVITHHLGAASAKISRREMVARGRVTYFRKHWSPPAAAFGSALLVSGYALRAALHALIGLVDRDRADRSWAGALRSVRSWIGGWPERSPSDRPRPTAA